MALDILKLTSSILYIIAAMIMVIIIFSVAISIKDFIPNIIAGIYIHKKKLFKEGDNIKIDNIEGKVQQITLTEIMLITKKGDQVHIPNSILAKKKITKKKRD